VILADTSAWVEFDRATASAVDQRMLELADEPELLAFTEAIRMEVLAGARDDIREAELARLLSRFRLLALDSVADFDSAARIYRRCRPAGVTPRGLIDCLIAAVAWRTGAELLHHDTDLARVADVVGIRTDPASVGG
jgi:predicted nucleic acid-binding protein